MLSLAYFFSLCYIEFNYFTGGICMNGLISIILPVYNRQDYLQECVDSIFAQSYSDYEIILIDDGSTDRTLEICKTLTNADPRIVLLQGSHSGVSAARNVGLNAAKGAYVFFLDSDDIIHPLLLETLVRAMEMHQAKMGGTKVVALPQYYWSKTIDLIKRSPGPGKTSYHTHAGSVQALFQGKSPLNVIGGVMMRRDLIGQTRFRNDIFIGEDYYFIYENLIKGADSVFLEQPWYYCRIHGSNSSNDYTYQGFWTRFYRRMLVWQNEEALGRKNNANVEKHSAFMAYLSCVEANRMPPEDVRKMCGVMKQHRKELLPALNFPRKVRFYMTVYCPFSHRIYCWMRNSLRKFKKKLKT